MYFFESIIELFCAISIPSAISQLNFRYKNPNVLASERNITVICNQAISDCSIRAKAVNTSPISHCELLGHKSHEKDALQRTVSLRKTNRIERLYQFGSVYLLSTNRLQLAKKEIDVAGLFSCGQVTTSAFPYSFTVHLKTVPISQPPQTER